MYTNKFNFYILSGSGELEKLLSAETPPEDSVCCFNTVTALPETLPLDSTVILDGGAELLQERGSLAPAEAVLLLTASEFFSDEADTELIQLADDIWVAPDKDRYNARAILLSFRKLIKRKKLAADHRKLSICMNTAIDSIPDLVWFKDDVGSHLAVNDGFCRAVEKTKEQIYKRGHYYIWDIPKEEYEQGEYVCLESEDIVMEARRTMLFDEKVKTKSGMRQFKTYKSPLIDTDGTLFGTCGVAHDVTDFDNINSEIRVILESMPFGTILCDRDGCVLSVNEKFHVIFSVGDEVVGRSFAELREQALKSDKIRREGDRLLVETRGVTMVLDFNEETIIDIFGEKMGTLGVFNDVTLLEENERRATEFANTDFLTGLSNRRKLFSYLNELEDKSSLAMIMVDLDNFKKVNDTFGHQAGDEALILTANTLRECFGEDFIARLGGDEFLVVISRSFTPEELEHETQALLDRLDELFSTQEQLHVATASAGIAWSYSLSGDIRSISDLMKRSDRALYSAKESGKAQYCIFDS